MSLASIMVKIGADISDLEKGLSQVSRHIEDTGKRMTAMGSTISKRVTAPIAALGTGILALQKTTGTYAAQLTNMSQATGVSTTSIQELQYALGNAGIEMSVMIRI